jgi:DNA modification methylase
MSINLLHGDCLAQMKKLDDNSVDSIVSDPPYGISFMAKKWDYDVPSVEVWKEAMRVLKPGGHALIACGTRTQHRMVVNIEDAGFEIRDVVSWIYGSGFPKSLNISKAIDKAAGAEREVVGERSRFGDGANRRLENAGAKGRTGVKFGYAHTKKEDSGGSGAVGVVPITAPATDEAKQWDGWGTALKPSVEFFTLCRKPLSEKTVAANVLKWGTGGINIDGCRVETDKDDPNLRPNKANHKNSVSVYGGNSLMESKTERIASKDDGCLTQGRFPANLIHDGSQEVLDLFPETKSGKGTGLTNTHARSWKNTSKAGINRIGHNDQGSAARFFYCPKASKKDRNEGCEEINAKSNMRVNAPRCDEESKTQTKHGNNHPTVKPTALMAYLCRLITPTGGVVLDPYMGSGSTGKAAVREGFSFVGIELDLDYYEICKARVTAETQGELKS